MIVEGDFESSLETRDLEKRQTVRQRKPMSLARKKEKIFLSRVCAQVLSFSVGHLAQMEM